jgi:hypothetical protein
LCPLFLSLSLSLSGKSPYPSPTALLKARIDLGLVFLISSGSGLGEPREKFRVASMQNGARRSSPDLTVSGNKSFNINRTTTMSYYSSDIVLLSAKNDSPREFQLLVAGLSWSRDCSCLLLKPVRHTFWCAFCVTYGRTTQISSYISDGHTFSSHAGASLECSGQMCYVNDSINLSVRVFADLSVSKHQRVLQRPKFFFEL